MAKKNKHTTLGEAKVLDEAADIKLAAAEKMSRANAILAGDDDTDDTDDNDFPELSPNPREARFAPAPASHELDPIDPPLSNFEGALADLAGRGRFEVYKLSMTGKRVKVGSYSLDEYPERLENLAQEHGGGTFRVMLKNERGAYVCSTTEEFDRKAYGGDKPAAAAAAEAGASATERLMERMDAREMEHRREMEAMRLENQKMMLLMIEKSTAPRQETNLVDAIKLVKELQGESRSPMDSFREVLELANSVKEETGLAEPEHPLVAAIDKVMKVASPLLTAWASKIATPAPASVPKAVAAKALPASTGKSEAVHAVIPNEPAALAAPALDPIPTPTEIDPRLKQYAESLFLQASSGASFESVADAVINLTPDDGLDELYTMATDPGFVGFLLKADARLEPHQAWLASLASYIKSEMDAAEAQGDSEPAVVAVAPAAKPEEVPA